MIIFQAPNQAPHAQYQPEMLNILEKFFDTRVAVPPYRPNAVTAFLRVIQCPANVFKDIFQIVHLEMDPAQAAKNNYKWTPRLCMAVPPSAPNIIPLCQPGLVRLKDKMLIFLQLTRVNVQLPPGQEPLSVCIPLVYDFGNNSTSLPQVRCLVSLCIMPPEGQGDRDRCEKGFVKYLSKCSAGWCAVTLPALLPS